MPNDQPQLTLQGQTWLCPRYDNFFGAANERHR